MDVKKFGKFIAAKRREKELTQSQLGEQLGVTGKTVSRWENGNYMPDISLLIPLSETLGVSLNELLNGESVKEDNSTPESSMISTIEYSERRQSLLRRQYTFRTVFIIAAIIFVLGAFYATIQQDNPWNIRSVTNIVSQNGFIITDDEDVSLSITINKEDLIELNEQETMHYSKNQKIVYRDDKITIYITSAYYNGQYMNFQFNCSYTLRDAGTIIVPYHVNSEKGETDDYTCSLSLVPPEGIDWIEYHDTAYIYGQGPSEEFAIAISIEAYEAAKNTITLTLDGLEQIDYVKR